ncbi:putative mitochondrial carrier domain-containing protein [Lupinus albus]|uniref:Putative mitochondrial carrier domain-containing protein n=1 Tax=Lupinus albus TaxID=3870 RepID=A0A6A4QHD9_LUPAL|nr:putative mitochondrial carrier domain-containing protein [Lupinus albus]
MHYNKNTNRVPNGGLKSSSHSQAPPKISEKIAKAQKIKGTRDYSFLLSDDAPVPKKEAPPQNISMRNSEGRPAQVTGKSKQPMMSGGKLVRGSGEDRKSVSGASHLCHQSGSNYKLTSASKAGNASADSRKQLSSSSGNRPAVSRKQLASNSGNGPGDSRRQLGSNSGSGPGRPVGPKGLPSKKPVITMMNTSSIPGIRSLVNGVHRPMPSKVHLSVPKQNVEQRKDLREQNKPKLVPRQPLVSSKAQVNKPPLKQNPMHSKSQDHHPRNKIVKRCTDDDGEDGIDIRSMIRSMFKFMGDVAKDLTAGTVGGAAQLITGHPFDTIKVKLQSQPTPLPGQLPKYSGAIDAVKQTIAAEGPRGLYKGMGAPLATVAAFNAVLFSVRGQMEAVLRSHPGAPLTISQQVVAGAGAGVAVSFLACPTELIKCRLQAQSALAGSGTATLAVKYGGPMDVARQVLRSEGGVKGLFKGLAPTMAREIPGNAAMFGVYESLKQYLAGGPDTSGLGRGSLIVAGGLAGASFWVMVYPTDVVKSVIQVDDYKSPKFSGSIDALRKIRATEGFKGLYKGFGPAMARSVPANAACFLAYEMTRSALG